MVVTGTGRWYVLGIDHSTGVAATRSFRIDRITAPHADRDHTVAPLPPGAQWPLHPTAWWSDPTVTTTVIFLADPGTTELISGHTFLDAQRRSLRHHQKRSGLPS